MYSLPKEFASSKIQNMHFGHLCTALSEMEVMQNARTLYLKSLKGIVLTPPNTNKIVLLAFNLHREA